MKKIVSSLLLGTLLAGGLYAKDCDYSKRDSSCMMKKDGDKRYNKQSSNDLRMFYELNLTPEQQTKIKQIMQEEFKGQKDMNEAFTKDSFDKEKYLQIMNEKRDNMLKSKAQVLEKAYLLLDNKQKEQLKTLLDLRKDKKSQRFED